MFLLWLTKTHYASSCRQGKAPSWRNGPDLSFLIAVQKYRLGRIMGFERCRAATPDSPPEIHPLSSMRASNFAILPTRLFAKDYL